MKKKDKRRIDELASRAFADLIEGSALDAPTIAPVPEYRLKFRMDSRKHNRKDSGPEIFPFVAAALALFVLLPALTGGSRPTIENSLASARDSGELASITNEFKDTMIRVSQTLQH